MNRRFGAMVGVAAVLVGACAPGADEDTEDSTSDESMLLAGERLSPARVASLLRQVGVEGAAVNKLVCTAKWESSFYTGAKNFNKNSAGQVTSTDIGLFQVNDRWWLEECGVTRNELLDPLVNAECAKQIYDQQGITAWYGYKAHKAECDSYTIEGDTGAPPGGGGGGSSSGAGACYSQSLQKTMEELSCVKSASNSAWYQCVDGQWFEGVSNGEGRGGDCTEMVQP